MSEQTKDSSEGSSNLERRSPPDKGRTDALLQSFSHDMATPLANIKLAADVVASAGGRLTEEKLQRLGRNMSSEADRLGRMIDTLTAWTRFEVGDRQLRLQWHLAEDLIGSALRASETLLDDHNVVVTIEPDMAYVRGDDSLIEMVLIHLIQNALGYTPKGEPIEIVARADDTGCSFEVIDAGPRLDVGDDPVAGAPFHAGNGSARSGQPRSGQPRSGQNSARSGQTGTSGANLGLILSRLIVEAHGGEIWTRDRKGESGAVFAFVLGYGGETPPHAPLDASLGDDGID